MARQRSHSIAFKRQVEEEFIVGESLCALSKRHDISRQLIRVYRVFFWHHCQRTSFRYGRIDVSSILGPIACTAEVAPPGGPP